MGKPTFTHIQPPKGGGVAIDCKTGAPDQRPRAINCTAYYRVSTDRQGKSGLGLEAQKQAVADFLAGNGWSLAGEFTEVESGKRKDRPQLMAAISETRRIKGKLIIAKLDRLARNVHFVSGLMESGVDFVAVDMPTADRFMLHVYAAMAEEEGRRISQRTKAALAAAKARGVELGSNGKTLAQRHKTEAEAFAFSLLPTILALHNGGHRTVRAITEALNDQGIPSREGRQWHLSSTALLLRRLGMAV